MRSTFNRADYVTPKEAAEIEGVTMRAIHHRIAEGRLPAVRIAGRRLLIHRDDVAAQFQPVKANAQ